MDIITVKTFFMWCSIINGALLVFSFLICAFAGDLVYKMHSKLFPIKIFFSFSIPLGTGCPFYYLVSIKHQRSQKIIGGIFFNSKS